MKKTKRFFIVILFIFLIIINVDKVRAEPYGSFGGSVNTAPPSSGGDGGSGGSSGTTETYPSTSGIENNQCYPNGCSINVYIQKYTEAVEYTFYDLFDNAMDSNKKILAGTYIGGRLTEKRSATWVASGSSETVCPWVECIKWDYDWVLEPEGCDPTKDRNCKSKKNWYNVYHTEAGYSCSSGTSTKKWTTTSYSYSEECQKKAEEKGEELATETVSGEPSYIVKVPDPNNARCQTENNDVLKTEGIICENYEIEGNIILEPTDWENRTVISNVFYETSGACIDVQTSKVRYLEKSASECKKNEYYISNYEEDTDNRHWHIFTPLNTKSSQEFFIQFTPKELTEKLKKSAELCIDIVNNYKEKFEYRNYIVDKYGNKFAGVNSEADKEKIISDKGCYFSTDIKIPIEQKFFYEENKTTEKIEFNGFNFYYRPINIYNPFPNMISQNSIWNNYKSFFSNDFDPFEDMTYNTTYNTNLRDIREYNKNYKYTDWSNMNINGTSKFIEEKSNILRDSKITANSFYSLGCGMLNQNKTIEEKVNSLYIKECDPTITAGNKLE